MQSEDLTHGERKQTSSYRGVGAMCAVWGWGNGRCRLLSVRLKDVLYSMGNIASIQEDFKSKPKKE